MSNATAIRAHARVSASNALVLGGTGENAVNVGIGTETPHSTLKVAASPDGGFGSYLQLPAVRVTAAPPPGDCDGTTQAGRMVLQENNGTITPWICAPAAAGAGMSGQSSSPGMWVAK